jgi:hypothetical protein
MLPPGNKGLKHAAEQCMISNTVRNMNSVFVQNWLHSNSIT